MTERLHFSLLLCTRQYSRGFTYTSEVFNCQEGGIEPHLILKEPLWSRCYYFSHFVNEMAKTQNSSVTCSSLHTSLSGGISVWTQQSGVLLMTVLYSFSAVHRLSPLKCHGYRLEGQQLKIQTCQSLLPFFSLFLQSCSICGLVHKGIFICFLYPQYLMRHWGVSLCQNFFMPLHLVNL